MQSLNEMRLSTSCESCVEKCCSQPHDWVYLTEKEVKEIESKSGLNRADFVVQQKNHATGFVFNTLNLPCQFLDTATGKCSIYSARPLVCRIFPFYTEPLTGTAALLPVQCGDNLHFLEPASLQGWRLMDFEQDIREWLIELWSEAMIRAQPAASTTRADGSP